MNSRIAQLTYAIGDIHGYDALFERLLDYIRVDAELIGERPRVILLGDYIDRGPASRQVLDRILRLREATWCDLVVLKGNHEEQLLKFLADPMTGETWRIWGGAATLTSYGVSMPFLANDPGVWCDVRDDFRRAVDPVHVEMLRSLPVSFQDGDYLFVHAGVDPDRPLAEQGPETFMYIRGRFQQAEQACEYVVVHGHTPEDPVTDLRWRIGVDSGVYKVGVLTAVRLRGDNRKLLQVRTDG
ncbi:serine/threonine protein phosphatase 1 [Asticcacaulis biprosthecium C19]|uniref:Serine/threonine protein phosphatase 1 n=1 Tax=Asticcacaulis biprosthecium C19 TaxID=715226 RepID=F4QNF0_9CAUL|nr:metallophosphoesterase [Asticcacaulis biprosthecium]EGF90858.1 serine/threonine protein phosphatase 1 [Asticcacaulis biprosthecium C19]